MQVCGKIQEAVSPVKLVLFALFLELQIIKNLLTPDKCTAVDIGLNVRVADAACYRLELLKFVTGK